MNQDMINFMQQFVKEVKPNESLSGFLKKRSQENQKTLGSPKNYFFLTSLCDPMKDFVKKKLPEQESTIDSKTRKIRGNKLHRFAKNWFQQMEGCEASESNLDGVYFGLPVVGRIDAKINGSIVELKTKEFIPTSIEEIFQRCPGDIEQLCFYSVLDPMKPKENYLIFLSHGRPFEVKAFKIKIKDHNKIKGVLKKRIDELSEALKKNNPSILGSCRYCWEGCSLKRDGFCEWDMIPRKECEVSDFIDIFEDSSFAKKFEKSINSWDGESETIPLYGILLSRKYFHKNILGLEDPFKKSAEEIRNEDYIKELVFDLKQSYKPLQADIPQPLCPEVLFSKNNWINYISSSNSTGEVLPFVVCTNEYDYPGVLTSPPRYRLAELGIVASLFKKSKGLIFIYYPKIQGGQYRVFEIKYSFGEMCRSKIEEVINILKSEDSNLVQNLPMCPYYFHKEGCNFKEICPEN